MHCLFQASSVGADGGLKESLEFFGYVNTRSILVSCEVSLSLVSEYILVIKLSMAASSIASQNFANIVWRSSSHSFLYCPDM